MVQREKSKKTPCLISPVFRSGLHILRRDRPLVIGRRPSCDVVLTHRSVSRRHCRIEWDDDSYRLVDLKSSNGTYLNGKRLIGDQRLTTEDSFSIGPFRLTYRELDDLSHTYPQFFVCTHLFLLKVSNPHYPLK